MFFIFTSKFRKELMTIKEEVDQALAAITAGFAANTAALTSLATAVASISAGNPVDLTAVTAAIAAVDAKVTDIQTQLET